MQDGLLSEFERPLFTAHTMLSQMLVAWHILSSCDGR